MGGPAGRQEAGGFEDLRAARDGDEAAGRRVVGKHGASMLRTAWRVLGRYGGNDAEDVVQEAFIAALTTEALPEADPGPWLRSIAARKALDALRRSSRRAELPLDDRREGVAPSGGVGSVPDDVLAVREALGRLSAADRAVLTLVDLEGFSMVEAARALGSTAMAVRWRAVRARRRLREWLDRGGVAARDRGAALPAPGTEGRDG